MRDNTYEKNSVNDIDIKTWLCPALIIDYIRWFKETLTDSDITLVQNLSRRNENVSSSDICKIISSGKNAQDYIVNEDGNTMDLSQIIALVSSVLLILLIPIIVVIIIRQRKSKNKSDETNVDDEQYDDVRVEDVYDEFNYDYQDVRYARVNESSNVDDNYYVGISQQGYIDMKHTSYLKITHGENLKDYRQRSCTNDNANLYFSKHEDIKK